MKIEQLLILQLIAHLLTDYTFQSNRKAKEKNKMGFKSKFLKWHVLLTFCLSWILSFQVNFVMGALVIAIGHWLIDGFKIYLNKSRIGNYAYFVDQLIHLIIITGTVFVFSKYISTETIFTFTIPTIYLAMVAAFLFCSKPANIFIKELFFTFNIHIKTNSKITELPNAGKLIGIVERWLVLLFIISNQFEAVGFLIAAKSILRFKDNETLKTEYVLIGTMVSFGLAIASGVAVRSFVY